MIKDFYVFLLLIFRFLNKNNFNIFFDTVSRASLKDNLEDLLQIILNIGIKSSFTI